MSGKENVKLGNLRLLLPACGVNLAAALCLMLCAAMLVGRGVVPEKYGLCAGVCLGLASAVSALFVCLRRGRVEAAVLSAVLSCVLIICIAMLLGESNCGWTQISIDFGIEIFAALLVCAVAAKRRKRKKSTKRPYKLYK